MYNKTKRLVSVILLVAVLFGMLSITVCAEPQKVVSAFGIEQTSVNPMLASDVVSVSSTTYIYIVMQTDTMGVFGTQQVSYVPYPSYLVPVWSSSNPDVATIDSSGFIRAISEGTTEIIATYYNSESQQISTSSKVLTVYDYLGIQNETAYTIMNYSSERLLSLEAAQDLEATNVKTKIRSNTAISQWTVIKQTDGRYKLMNNYSQTGKCMTSSTNDNLVICTDTDSNSFRFTIDRVDSGTYSGLYLIRYGDKYVAEDSNHNVYLTTSLSSSAYWSFMAVEKRYADLYSFQYTGFNTTANNELFESVLGNKGYIADASWVNGSASQAYEYMIYDDDIFVFRGHGNAGVIAFYSNSGVITGAIGVNDRICRAYGAGDSGKSIDSIGHNGLASLRMVLYIGCSTGGDYVIGNNTYNLVTSTYNKGAHFVLGTTQSVITGDSNNFLKGFLEELSADNGSVMDCINAGIAKAGDIDPENNVYDVYPIIYFGDTIQYFDF